MKYTAVCQKYICFSKLSIPLQQLIADVMILSEICMKCFDDGQITASIIQEINWKNLQNLKPR